MLRGVTYMVDIPPITSVNIIIAIIDIFIIILLDNINY